jgi:hypothetical protein
VFFRPDTAGKHETKHHTYRKNPSRSLHVPSLAENYLAGAVLALAMSEKMVAVIPEG